MPGLLYTTVTAAQPTGGDRGIAKTRVFPSSMFYRNGGRVIDVTQDVSSLPAPYNVANALNNGTAAAQTTAAIRAAYNFIVSLLRIEPRNTPSTNYIIYFPAGTYLVNDTIDWDGTYTVENSDTPNEIDNHQYIRFIGENRNTTTIKLTNSNPLFNSSATYGGQPWRPVISFIRDAINPSGKPFNNLETKSPVRGLTIDTGTGNPGAVGINYVGANANELCELNIQGTGKYGIYFAGSSLVWAHDTTVTGFQVGIESEWIGETNITIEHVTVSGQSLAGVRTKDSCITIRDLYSNNVVPAVDLTGQGSYLAIVDSVLVGGVPGNPAIRYHNTGACFARNVTTNGYGHAIRKGTTTMVVGPNVTEFLSHPARTAFGGAGTDASLTLPVEEAPHVEWPAVGDWAVVTADGNAATQAALNSGKPGIMFKGHTFSIGTVNVPASVKYVYCAFAKITGTFRLSENSPDPVLFEDGCGFLIEQNGKTRTVVMSSTYRSARYRNATPQSSDKLFMNCCASIQNESGTFIIRTQKLWGRCINNEAKNLAETPVELCVFDFRDGAEVWVLGGKVESNAHAWGVRNGAKLDAIGCYANQTVFAGAMGAEPRTTSVVVRCEDSQISFSGYTDGHNNPGYRDQSRSIAGETTINKPYTDFPKRFGRAYNCFIPLFREDIP